MAESRSTPPRTVPQVSDLTSNGSLHPVEGANESARVLCGELHNSSLLLSCCCYCSFTPLEFAPAAWVALFPLMPLVRPDTCPRDVSCPDGAGFFMEPLHAPVDATRACYDVRCPRRARRLSVALFPAFLMLSRRLVATGEYLPGWQCPSSGLLLNMRALICSPASRGITSVTHSTAG